MKGFITEASSKVSVGSIPSKFETIIYKNNNKVVKYNCKNIKNF